MMVSLFFGGGIAGAQNPAAVPKEGGLRVVNLVAAGAGNLELTMDGAVPDKWKDGFKLGDRTGLFKMPVGDLEFVLSKEGCKTSKRTVQVLLGKTMTLVCYADPIRDDTGKIVDWELKMASLRQRTEPNGLFFTLVSFLEEDEIELEVVDSLSNKEQAVVLPKRKATPVEVNAGLVNVRISHEGKLLKALSTKRRGNYVVMFYMNGDGERETVTYYDRKFVLAN